MKKILAIAICGLMLAGCGKAATETTAVESEAVSESVAETPEATETPEPTPTELPDPTETPTPEPTEEPTPEPTPEATPEPEGPYTWEGTTVDDADMKKVPYLTVENMGLHFESGPIQMDITGMQIAEITFHDADLADTAELDQDTPATMVTLDVSAENTSEEEVFFPFDSTLVTNTKEQAHDNYSFGEYQDGTFYGNVIQDAFLVFFLPKTSPEELAELKFIFEAPYGSEYGDLGEKITFTILPEDYQ